MDDDSNKGHSPLYGRGRPALAMSREEIRRLQQAPEWLAAKGLITAAEYLMMFGDHRGPVEDLEREGLLVGPPRPRHLYRKR